MNYYVNAAWDAEASVFCVADTNVPGLAIEAANPQLLAQEVAGLLPVLFEANGLKAPPSVSFTIQQVEETIRVSAAA